MNSTRRHINYNIFASHKVYRIAIKIFFFVIRFGLLIPKTLHSYSIIIIACTDEQSGVHPLQQYTYTLSIFLFLGRILRDTSHGFWINANLCRI